MGAKIYFLSKSASERIFFPILLQLPVNEGLVAAWIFFSHLNKAHKRLAVLQVLCNLKTSQTHCLVMALKIIDHGTSEYRQMIKLRDDILRRPLGLGFDIEELDEEKDNMLIGAFDDDQMLGCCMLVEENPTTIKLRQMAVLNDLQGKGIGRALMNFAENIARDRGYKIMSMHARKNVVGFYEKMGYKVTSPEFIEVTIPHYRMEKKL